MTTKKRKAGKVATRESSRGSASKSPQPVHRGMGQPGLCLPDEEGWKRIFDDSVGIQDSQQLRVRLVTAAADYVAWPRIGKRGSSFIEPKEWEHRQETLQAAGKVLAALADPEEYDLDRLISVATGVFRRRRYSSRTDDSGKPLIEYDSYPSLENVRAELLRVARFLADVGEAGAEIAPRTRGPNVGRQHFVKALAEAYLKYGGRSLNVSYVRGSKKWRGSFHKFVRPVADEFDLWRDDKCGEKAKPGNSARLTPRTLVRDIEIVRQMQRDYLGAHGIEDPPDDDRALFLLATDLREAKAR